MALLLGSAFVGSGFTMAPINFAANDATALLQKTTSGTDVTLNPTITSVTLGDGILQFQLSTSVGTADTTNLLVSSIISGFSGTFSLLAKGANDNGYVEVSNDFSGENILAESGSSNLHLNGDTTLTAHTVQANRKLTIANGKFINFSSTAVGIGGNITFGDATSFIKVGEATQLRTSVPTFSGVGFAQITQNMTLTQAESQALSAANLAKLQIPSGVTLTITG